MLQSEKLPAKKLRKCADLLMEGVDLYELADFFEEKPYLLDENGNPIMYDVGKIQAKMACLEFGMKERGRSATFAD
eukprot:gene22845-27611_t